MSADSWFSWKSLAQEGFEPRDLKKNLKLSTALFGESSLKLVYVHIRDF